jgi:DNA-binding NtrC family response regulator
VPARTRQSTTISQAVPSRPRTIGIHFLGRRPPSELQQRLAALGVAIVPASEEALLDVRASDRVDRPPSDETSSPWIWWSPGPAGARAIGKAAAAGAIDVVDGTRPADELAARLAARAKEVALPAELARTAPEFVAEGPAAQHLISELTQAARTSMPVLLTGETGTGKELAARLLHEWSPRQKRSFVPINCAAIPNEMLEAELFGYAKGAFSGAVQAYEGQLAQGAGGSVFLDEVDDTPLSFQVKLLRVLEDRVVSRLGENEWHRVDFRIIAATNRDLPGLIAQGQFGADLYQRLAIISIRLPPLRERREDLLPLCQLLVARFYRDEPAARDRHAVTEVTAEALAVLTAYDWPGNIRELRNVLYSALVRKRGGTQLLVSDLPRRLLDPSAEVEGGRPSIIDRNLIRSEIERGCFNLRATLEQLEREALGLALAHANGNAAAAAGLLGEVGRGEARDPGATVRAMMRRLRVK